MKRITAFTLVEILVSLVVFALVIAGLTSVFIAGGKLITHNRERMTSAELGKLFLDPLQTQVMYGSWNTDATYGWNGSNNDLREGSRAASSQNINNRIFDEVHTVSNVTVTAGNVVRKVTSTMNWNEPSP